MAMSEALLIAVPAVVGVTLITPKKYSIPITILLVTLGAGCGLISQNLEREGKLKDSINWDIVSTTLKTLGIVRALN